MISQDPYSFLGKYATMNQFVGRFLFEGHQRGYGNTPAKDIPPPAAAGVVSTQDWMEWWYYRSLHSKTLLVTTLFSEEGVWGFTLGPSYILLRRRQFNTSKVTSYGVIFPPFKTWALNWEQSPAGGAVQWRGGGRAGSRWTGWGGCLRPGGLSDCAEEPSGFPQTLLSSCPVYLLI